MEHGFIPISRKLFEHPFWQEERTFSYAEAWIDLIRMARFNHTPGNFLIKARLIKYERGEQPISLRHLGTLWNWSPGKVDRFLDILEEEKMISRKKVHGTQQTILTICKYEEYNNPFPQQDDFDTTQQNTGETPAEHRQDNSNKENKENKESGCTPPASPEYEKFQNWMQQNTPYCANPENFNHSMTEEEFLRLKENYTGKEIADVLLNIENRKDLRKKYANLYRTILNWLKREYGDR